MPLGEQTNVSGRVFSPRLLRVGSSALIAQGVNSAGNLLAGAVVARFLGAAALGSFSVLFATMLCIVALQTSWVGDSMTVLGRNSAALRDGIAASQMWCTLLGAAVAAAIAAAATDVDVWGVIGFAVLVGAWQLEEYGRRVFMARLEFLRLAVNDGVYLATLLGGLFVLGIGPGLSLTLVVWSMAFAALAAFAAGVGTMPREDRLHFTLARGAGLRLVARYGSWRAAQSGIGLLSGLGARLILSGFASMTLLGQVEAGRLVVAPLFVALAASSNVLLAFFSRSEDERGSRRAALRGATGLLALLAVGYGGLVLAFPGAIEKLVAGETFTADRVILGGWLLQALVLAIGNPMSSVALVEGRAAEVFWMKLCGAAASVLLAFGSVAIDRPTLVPAAIAAGQAASAVLVWQSNRKHEARTEAADITAIAAAHPLERAAS